MMSFLMLPLQTYQELVLKMIVVSKIPLFGRYYLRLMRKEDPDCVGERKALMTYVNQQMILPI